MRRHEWSIALAAFLFIRSVIAAGIAIHFTQTTPLMT